MGVVGKVRRDGGEEVWGRVYGVSVGKCVGVWGGMGGVGEGKKRCEGECVGKCMGRVWREWKVCWGVGEVGRDGWGT